MFVTQYLATTQNFLTVKTGGRHNCQIKLLLTAGIRSGDKIMQTTKILFIDLEVVRGKDKSGISEIFKSWRGFQCVGLAAPANSLNMSQAHLR